MRHHPYGAGTTGRLRRRTYPMKPAPEWRWLLPRVRWMVELRDLWVGVYWTHESHLVDPRLRSSHDRRHEFRVYVCLLPCLPIRFTWTWRS
jgi:hypothetical protein